MNSNAALALFTTMFAGLTCSPAHGRSDSPVGLAIRNYDIDLRVDYEQEMINARCDLTLLNTSDVTQSELPLLLYRLLRVSAATDGEGRALEVSQNVQGYEDWPQFQANVIRIGLAEPLAPGARTTISLAYDGYLLGYDETGMLYLTDSIDPKFTIVRTDMLAYPKIGVASWGDTRALGMPEFDYRLRVTVPDRYVVANGGGLEDVTRHEGLVTYTYHNLKPAWRLDAAIAEYEVLKSGPHTVFCFAEDAEGGRFVVERMQQSLALFTEWFGPLQSDRGLAIIEIPDGRGSQTDVTSIIQSAAAFKDPTNVYEVYHEVSHLWNPAPNDPQPCRVESEGLATFLQYLLLEEIDDDQGALERGYERMTKRLASSFANSTSNRDTPIRAYGEEGVTGLSYNKGGLFFAVLYELEGQEGFLALIRDYFTKYATDGATLDEFLGVVRAHSSHDIDRLVEEWIDGAASSTLITDAQTPAQMAMRYRKD